jgi:hypothetical protein
MECVFTCMWDPFESLTEYDSYEYCVPDYPVIELVLHAHDLGDSIDSIDASEEGQGRWTGERRSGG